MAAGGSSTLQIHGAQDPAAPDVPSRPPQPELPVIASGQMRSLQTGRRALRWLALVLPPVLIGYALFDKGFAYIHVPPIPIFAGEVVMLFGLTAAAVATGYVHRGLERSAIAKLLLVFAAWGALRTVPNLGRDGIDAIRDAALWYYSLVAIPICGLVLWDRDLLARWSRGYRRVIPWILVSSPIALLLSKPATNGLAPLVPGSSISIWDHKPNSIAIHVTIALAFLWLVPEVGGRFRPLLTGLGAVIILMGATQNRGGFVAAVAGLGLAWLFAAKRGRMTFVMLSTIVLCVMLGWGLNIQIGGGQNRSISVEQLARNIGSLVGVGSSQDAGNLAGNVEFREHLWSTVIERVTREQRVMTGLGFGPNLTTDLGFQDDGPALRSPHNSHVDVFARMGVIGITIWLALWASFFWIAFRARARLRRAGRPFEKGLLEVCVVGVTAILINAYFDPTLESPQVAIWLWTLVGLTLGLVAVARASHVARPATTTV